MYAIIDTETTGGNPRKDKLTEIAIVIHNGSEIVQEYSTLINPECRIPGYITQITGITDDMVAEAPKFYEIARNIVEITENSVFVSHNVQFDYHFIRNEFCRLGYEYKREKLCTVRLSQKLLPNMRSYSLGNLCHELGIPVTGRHRARGDAYATARLFEILTQRNGSSDFHHFQNRSKISQDIHPLLNKDIFEKLPELAGVYYFYDQDAYLIYIGKSKNIRSRVLAHFTSHSSRRAMEMRNRIADINYEVTGSELIALLKESDEIKKHKPMYNRAQRRNAFQYGLFSEKDLNGYVQLLIDRTCNRQSVPLFSFTGRTEARRFLSEWIDRYELCQKLCHTYATTGNCFHYEIGSCRGACLGKEKPEDYNVRVWQAVRDHSLENRNLLIIDTGRNIEERSVVKIENGKYMGFGYFSTEYASDQPDIMMDCINGYSDSRDVRNIIIRYLRNNPVEKILVY
ncbi:MAG: GIY-YIG nuclease family protein [Bacteroidales bacterium]|nr:GIY-YIG nuclease family protein [Bacteroidales bacterium]